MGKAMSVARRSASQKSTKETQSKTTSKKRVSPLPAEPSPDYLKRVNEVNQVFNDRLKQVFVKSIDQNAQLEPTKPMPADRTIRTPVRPHSEEVEEPTMRMEKKLTVGQIKDLLDDYENSPEEWPIERVIAEYDLEPKMAENLVNHFKALEVYIPNIHTRANLKMIKTEPIPNVITSDTLLPELEKIMGAKRKYQHLPIGQAILAGLKEEPDIPPDKIKHDEDRVVAYRKDLEPDPPKS